MGCHHQRVGVLMLLVLLSQTWTSWGWFFTSSKETDSSKGSWESYREVSGNAVAEFSMEPFNNQRGIKLVENARRKMLVPSTCWTIAYQNVFAGCSKALADEELRSRLAWHLSDCFQKHSGRPSFPYCDAKSSMVKCLQKLDEDARKIYLEYFLETNSFCHQLQIETFRQQTERLVNDLKSSAEYAEEKLEKIEERGNLLLQNSKELQDSLSSIDVRTQKVAESSKVVEGHVHEVLKHSEAVYQQSMGIAASQEKLNEGQVKMKEKLTESMMILQDSYNNLGREINNLKIEAAAIEKEIGRVGDAMLQKMSNLQNKAEDIGNMAGISLDKQKQLLDGQSVALEGLDFLTKFQSQALEESRGTLQQLAEFGHRQQDELLRRQQLLQQAHDHLVENSKSILEAQEAFESKQASMFLALDKLFTLHNAMLLESRVMKAFFIYSISIFIIFMLTSTKQTYNIRPRLYIGLCISLTLEIAILRCTTYNMDHQGWMISSVRSTALLLASLQLLYTIFTYRDYEMLNHKMLLTLIEKVNGMEKDKELTWDRESDSEVDWSSWIDSDLPEDVDYLEDPDYVFLEEVGENLVETSTSSQRYNFRKHPSRFS